MSSKSFLKVPKLQISIVPFLVGTHVALSFMSVVNSQILPSQYPSLSKEDDEVEESFDAVHYDMVKKFIANMYSGRGIDLETSLRNSDNIGSVAGHDDHGKHASTSLTNNISIVNDNFAVQLASSVTFEDPVAICKGPQEIQEAFRALSNSMHPISLSSPKCIDVYPHGDTINLTFVLHQQYTLPLYGPFQLHTILLVSVQLQPLQDEPEESIFLITDMRELWNGKPLAWPNVLYTPSRRINGIISYYLTSWFI